MPLNNFDSVGNLATVHFAAHLFGLPLKTKGNPRGVFTEHELYMANAVIFQAVFFDYDLMRSYPLRQAARAVAKKIGDMVELNVKSVGSNGVISHFIDGLRKQDNPLSDYGENVVKNLLDSGLNAHEVTWTQILPAVVSMVPKLGQVVSSFHRVKPSRRRSINEYLIVHSSHRLLSLRCWKGILARHQPPSQVEHT